MKKYIYLLSLFCVNCGNSTVTIVEYSPDLIPAVEMEISRLENGIIWCDDFVVSPASNNLTGQANCGGGDSMYWNGFVSLFNKKYRERIQLGLEKSIDWDNNYPYRHPTYVKKDIENEFSRDQLQGLVNSTLFSEESLRIKIVSKVFNNFYTNNTLCLHPTDNRCYINDSSSLGFKLFFGYNMPLSQLIIDKSIVLGEAKTVPEGYQQMLVAQKIYFRYFTGQGNYKTAINTLVSRSPDNIFFQFVQKAIYKELEKNKEYLLNSLLICMQSLKEPNHEPLWEGHNDCTKGMGWETSSLAQYLIEGDFRTISEGVLTDNEKDSE